MLVAHKHRCTSSPLHFLGAAADGGRLPHGQPPLFLFRRARLIWFTHHPPDRP